MSEQWDFGPAWKRLCDTMGWPEPDPPTASNRNGPRPLPAPPLSRDARAMRRRRVALAAMRRAVRRGT